GGGGGDDERGIGFEIGRSGIDLEKCYAQRVTFSKRNRRNRPVGPRPPSWVRDMEVRLRQVSFCGSDYRAYVIRSVIRRSFMPESVADLEQQRAAVLRQISELE